MMKKLFNQVDVEGETLLQSHACAFWLLWLEEMGGT